MISFKRIWEPLPAGSPAAEKPDSASEFTFRPLWRGAKPPLMTADAVLELSEAAESAPFIAEEETIAQVVEPERPEPEPPCESGRPDIGTVSEDPVPPVAMPLEQASPEPLERHVDFDAVVAQDKQAAFEAGIEQGRAEAESVFAAERAELRALVTALDQAFELPANFFEPLKRLALHIAETVVRGELESRADIIEQAIADCCSGIDEKAVVCVRLNPTDVELLHKGESPLAQRLEILADAKISRGSVKVELDDGWIEDIIEDRWKSVQAALKLDR